MAFFRNRTVNLLNLHYGIHAVALSGGEAFFAIYLLKAGVPVVGVLLSIAAILLGRFIIRPSVIGLAVRCGLRRMLIAGTVINAAQYPLLAEVHGLGAALAALIFVSAVGSTAYWTTYHAYFAALGDNELRGHQIGAREAIAALVGIVSPLATGWMLVAFGPRVAFGATAAINVLAAAPLLFTPEVVVGRYVEGGFRAALPGVLLFIADGWLDAGYLVVWWIALFISLGENFVAYGGALALAALVGAVAGMTLGRQIDAGHGRRAVWFGLIPLAMVIVLRAGAAGHPALAVLANAAGALAGCLYIPALMAPLYTLAKNSPCPLRFHVATEGGWDLGGAAGLLTAAAATAADLPLSASILTALAGVVAIIALLRGYYAREAARCRSASNGAIWPPAV